MCKLGNAEQGGPDCLLSPCVFFLLWVPCVPPFQSSEFSVIKMVSEEALPRRRAAWVGALNPKGLVGHFYERTR